MKSIEEIFQASQELSRQFMKEVRRCSLKGWPDRKRELDVSFELQELLVSEREMRFQHLLQAGEIGRQSWRSLLDLTNRLGEGWTDADEAALKNRNSEYARISEAIQQRRRSLDANAIEGPLRDAQRDAEYKQARSVYFQCLKDLNAQLERAERNAHVAQ